MNAKPRIVLALLLAAACSKAPEPAKADQEAEATPAPVQTHPPMARHFEEAARIRDAIIAGELEDIREPARWLAEGMSVIDYPEGWRNHVLRMQQEAQALVAVQDIGVAATKSAMLATICGECHRHLGVGPRIEIDAPPEVTGGTGAHMLRHQWAAERMWEGLIGPSDDAWTVGAKALEESPMEAKKLTEDVELPAEVIALRSRVHELARTGATVREPAHRAAILGEFFAGCAACHKGGC
ncbi:MAG: hypothetical protein KC486_23310 [Myxococcales bacterium]|nr:hypothetical protein [Myxococcales bacterium]